MTRKYLAVDELDLYLLALDRGLWVEPNPEKRAASMPWKAQASVAEKRRFAAQRREIIESRTGPLDAWYAAQLDPSAPAADKPRLASNGELLELIDRLAASGSPGWLPASTVLLELNARSQREAARRPRDLARQGRLDGRGHSMTQVLTDTSGNVMLVVFACQGRDGTDIAVSHDIPGYLAAKKHQINASRAIALIFDGSGTTLERVIYDNKVNEPSAELDAASSRLVPVGRMTQKVPRPGRPRKSGKAGPKPRR